MSTLTRRSICQRFPGYADRFACAPEVKVEIADHLAACAAEAAERHAAIAEPADALAGGCKGAAEGPGAASSAEADGERGAELADMPVEAVAGAAHGDPADEEEQEEDADLLAELEEECEEENGGETVDEHNVVPAGQQEVEKDNGDNECHGDGMGQRKAPSYTMELGEAVDAAVKGLQVDAANPDAEDFRRKQLQVRQSEKEKTQNEKEEKKVERNAKRQAEAEAGPKKRGRPRSKPAVEVPEQPEPVAEPTKPERRTPKVKTADVPEKEAKPTKETKKRKTHKSNEDGEGEVAMRLRNAWRAEHHAVASQVKDIDKVVMNECLNLMKSRVEDTCGREAVREACGAGKWGPKYRITIYWDRSAIGIHVRTEKEKFVQIFYFGTTFVKGYISVAALLARKMCERLIREGNRYWASEAAFVYEQILRNSAAHAATFLD